MLKTGLLAAAQNSRSFRKLWQPQKHGTRPGISEHAPPAHYVLCLPAAWVGALYRSRLAHLPRFPISASVPNVVEELPLLSSAAALMLTTLSSCLDSTETAVDESPGPRTIRAKLSTMLAASSF